jgi:hypothetical protein
MGNAARHLLETRFDMRIAMARWDAVLEIDGGGQR